MYRKIDDFIHSWEYEVQATQKVFAALTDQSLSQAVAQDHRTIGRIAWHITTTISEMMKYAGVTVSGPDPHSLPPRDAATIRKAYAETAASLAEQIKSKWNDAALEVVVDMYGEKWPRGATLAALVAHQTHHRGQTTVLMRQAGLKVPGIYGPALEEWGQYNQPAPPV